MKRCVTLNFTGTRTASLPLKSTQNADDFLAQLHFNVYPVIAMMGERSAAFEQLDAKSIVKSTEAAQQFQNRP
jgi:hypothetical protein